MPVVKIHYWSDYKLTSKISIEHISLETSTEYFSFYPVIEEEKQLRSDQLLMGKFANREQEVKRTGQPDQTIKLDLDEQSINSTINYLMSQESDIHWQRFKMKKTEGFNSATAVLLLLKLGGLAKKLKVNKYKYPDGRYKSQSLKALFESYALSPQEFPFFIKEAWDASPEGVKDLAEERASIKVPFFNYLKFFFSYRKVKWLIFFTLVTIISRNYLLSKLRPDFGDISGVRGDSGVSPLPTSQETLSPGALLSSVLYSVSLGLDNKAPSSLASSSLSQETAQSTYTEFLPELESKNSPVIQSSSESNLSSMSKDSPLQAEANIKADVTAEVEPNPNPSIPVTAEPPSNLHS